MFFLGPGTSLASNACRGGKGRGQPMTWNKNRLLLSISFLKASCWWLTWHLAQRSSGLPQHGGRSCGSREPSYLVTLPTSWYLKGLRALPRVTRVIPAPSKDRIHLQALSLCQASPSSRYYTTGGRRVSSQSRLYRRVCLGVLIVPASRDSSRAQLCPCQDCVIVGAHGGLWPGL